MKFLLVVKLSLSKPFAHWAERFDQHSQARAAAGIEDVFRHPVIGEQAAVYAVRTTTPRAVHDMIYDPAVRGHIEESGFVIGSEQILVCDGEV
ncbi:Protein of unknown function (DUF3764) [Caulobacter sp. AP07]|uniref:hypothetical protein n=1 Tax=Caulobacter sp. AP07 TaxID=1144304 RepID=UPI000271EDE5|nr:hypothetical protein [Caulobacter sp. AP07]EJL30813.1 Protein of unknown function (DUF3764) [Caulobacter sp. AP07]